MRDSLEDRIHQDGNHAKFKAAHERFVKSKRSRNDQQDFYDVLEGLGASPEEADEFVNMVMEN